MKTLIKLLALFAFLPKICFCNVIHEKVLICGICKDVEPYLQNMISSIENLSKHFKDYRVIIYENNSKDGTKEILKTWSKKNKNVLTICEDLTEAEFSTFCKTKQKGGFHRIERITHARNIVLKEAYKSKYDDYKYLIMADLDFCVPWSTKEILSSFDSQEPWEAITANGLRENMSYYDKLALRSSKWPIGPEIGGRFFWKYAKASSFKFKGNKLIPVMSAFGGLGIYKLNTIRNIYYECYPNKELQAYYKDLFNIPFHLQHPMVQGILKAQGISSGKKFLKSEQFYNFVTCEHVNFHAKLQKTRGARIYINPKMHIYRIYPKRH